MKCSHQRDFIIILLIILTTNDKGKAFVLLSKEKSFEKHSGVFSASKNTLQDLDLYPNMNNPDIPKHRIVKKQMAISDENQSLGKSKNRFVDKEKSFSTDTSTDFKDTNMNTATGFNSWIIQKLHEHEAPTPSSHDRERFIRPAKEIPNEKTFKKFQSIKRNDLRLKRDLLMRKKVEIPDFGSNDPDNEPSNEWMDASQDNNQKIPPEFKPKPKLTLKIFHLNCKRELNDHERENTVGKRQTWNRFMCFDSGRRAIHPAKVYSTRVHPRSFLVRIKKKGESKNTRREENKNEAGKPEKDDEEDDEENEEDEDDSDDEEEDDETEYEDTDEDSVSITLKPDHKDTIREFFKTAKEAVINRAKFDDGSVSGSLNEKESLTSSKNDKTESFSDKSKKVLIDANIKLDGAISHALKSILGFRKEKISEPKENNEKLTREKDMEENINVKDTNNESQLTGKSEHPNNRNKRHLLSLLSKKNKDGEGSEKGGLVSVDSLINCLNSEYDREELLQKLQQIKYKDTRLSRYDLLVK